jgi:hypothetical protein
MDPIATLTMTMTTLLSVLPANPCLLVLTSDVNPDSIVPQTETFALFFSVVSPVSKEEE